MFMYNYWSDNNEIEYHRSDDSPPLRPLDPPRTDCPSSPLSVDSLSRVLASCVRDELLLLLARFI